MIQPMSNLQRKRPERRGMALVITLSVLVLMTTLVLAFFSRSTFNRQIAYTSTNLIKTDTLARNALTIIVGEIRDEIASASYSTPLTAGTPTLYKPITTADVLPKKVGVAGTDTLGGMTLLKVTTSSAGIRPNGPTSLVGSSVLISDTSLNGRSLSSSRWFGSGGPKLGSSNVPSWMILTRGNSVKVPTIANAKDVTSNDYVIGRFAYTVYDLGVLMNINVAGYPTVASSCAPYKSSLAYADLTALGLFSSDVNNLLAWRNVTTGTDLNTFNEWASGLTRSSGTSNSSALAAAQSGYISSAQGDNAFFSRRDFLNNATFASYQGMFTHFYRSLTSPSWFPRSNAPSPSLYTYSTSAESTTLNALPNPNRNIPNLRFVTPTNPFLLTHYLDNGTTQNYYVSTGDSLLQHRFSLARLTWLTYTGIKTGITPAAVQSCFGLQWDGPNERWNYVGSTGNTIQSSIKTLAMVAAEPTPREPNFFETLKAGILLGSTGLASANTTKANPNQKDLDKNTDLQILRIGANIIDSVSSENYPTTLVLSATVAGTLASVPVHGVKDLPYLYHVLTTSMRKVTSVAGTSTMNNLALVMVPELFNPHAPSGITTGPTQIRIRLASGKINKTYISSRNAAGQPLYHDSGTPFTPAAVTSPLDKSIVHPLTSGSFRNGVAPVTSAIATSTTSLNTLLPWLSNPVNTTHGFVIYDYTTGPGGELPRTYATAIGGILRADITSGEDIMIVLEYRSPSGQWRVYDTMFGNEATMGQSGKLEFGPDMNGCSVIQTGLGSGAPCSMTSKIDPRSTRFGAGYGILYYATTTAPVSPSASEGLRAGLPFGSGTILGAPTGLFPGLWPQGGKTGWSDVNTVNNVIDPDNTVRPADGWGGSSAASSTATTSNLFQNVSNPAHTARPVILGRPFRSVGELGYVFRDSPWKTLSFFDDTSGDSALLDLFSVADEPIVTAARVSLNSRQPLIHQALLSGSAQSCDGTSTLSSPTAIATAYNTFAFASGVPTAALPFNVSNLANFMSSGALTTAYPMSTTPMKYSRESVVRAMASSTQTRTWNLLIDVVAQSGRYSAQATSLSNFLVEGERRYWMSIAIDRYTGAVIGQQLELVNE